jgi:membrane fusion protein
MTLFRHEVQSARAERTEGDVFVSLPTSWHLLGMLMGTALIVTVIFLTIADYARVEAARGVLVPDRGVVSVLAARGGVVTDLRVVEGAEVLEGESLLSVRTDAVLKSGETTVQREQTRIAEQRRQIDAQIDAVRAAEVERTARVEGRLRTLKERITIAREQVTLQAKRVNQTEAERYRFAELRERDLATAPQLADRDAALVAAKSDLLRAEQELNDLIAERDDADEADREAAAITLERIAALMAQRTELDGTETEIARDSAFVLSAPVTGTVTNLTARLGHAIGPNVPAMLILPEGARLQADLSIPASAIGFVEAGQQVRLAIDTFPVERFGVVEGRVTMVSRTSVIAEGGVRVYHATVAIETPSIYAYDREFPLQSGMTLNARIVTAERSLIEWLFDPLFALARR